jgi:hypothetical protein
VLVDDRGVDVRNLGPLGEAVDDERVEGSAVRDVR